MAIPDSIFLGVVILTLSGVEWGRTPVFVSVLSVRGMYTALIRIYGNNRSFRHPSSVLENRNRSCIRPSPLFQNSIRSGRNKYPLQ